MINKIKSILYTVDIIGSNPQLYIFKNTRYKSFFSSVISILIILFSISFIIFSLSQYLKYDTPIISYSKGNDKVTKRSIFINDTFLMFQLMDSTTKKNINNSIAYYEADYGVLYDNGNKEGKTLEIEKCELGKNIDKKFETYINDNLS